MPACSGSRSEKLCRKIVEGAMLETFPNRRPKFLKGLELDGYNADLKIAFEYNGIQHYEYYPDFFHKNGIEVFHQQQERDAQKKLICEKRGITLLIIPTHFHLKKLRSSGILFIIIY